MTPPVKKIIVSSADKGNWLAKISEIYYAFDKVEPHCITFSFDSGIALEQIEPVHLVTFACLIQYLIDKGHSVFMDTSNSRFHEYIFKELKFAEYWGGGKNHVDASTSDNIFNLWRIVDSEKDLYATKVTDYFNRTDFSDKDLSGLSVSLVEAFYNVFDHARANKNAFLLLRYEPEEKKLRIAISDFGIGIGASVRKFNPSFSSDIEAIQWAIRDHSTVKSTMHNKGLGMGNILAVAENARIFSGYGLLVMRGDSVKPLTMNFKYPGTLIYMDVDLSSFDDIEIIDSFNW